MMPTAQSPLVFSAPAAVVSPRWAEWFHVAGPLLLIVTACVLFRLPLATGPAELCFPLDPEMVAKPWTLLGQIDFGGGRYRWTPTGYVPIGLLNLVMPSPFIFVLLLSLLVVVSYWLSWRAMQSRVFSITLAMCMGFGTQFNYVYIHNGGHLWVVYTTYLLINLYFLHAVAADRTNVRHPRVGFVISLIVFALCWEQWLDYLVFLLAGCGVAFLLCRNDPELRRVHLGRIRFVAATSVLVAVAYLAVKVPMSREHFTPGHESDTIFTYSSAILAIDDFVASLFTYTYMALTNFCPSWFNASNSLYHLGAERILQEQNGYHPEKTELVAMHHLFLWHYYAGAVVFGFGLLCYRCAGKVWRERSYHAGMIAALLLLICTGFATHTIIKFRPYLSVPLLAYKCIISVTGVALLLSYYLSVLAQKWPQRKSLVLLIVAWGLLVFAGVERFSYHSKMAQQAGLGRYPEPVRAIKDAVRTMVRQR